MDLELSQLKSWEFVQYGGSPDQDAISLIESYIEAFQLYKMKVFSSSGLVVYSTDEEDVGFFNERDYFHQKIARGEIVSKIVRTQAELLEEQIFQADVIEVYVPVMRNRQFFGAFEIWLVSRFIATFQTNSRRR